MKSALTATPNRQPAFYKKQKIFGTSMDELLSADQPYAGAKDLVCWLHERKVKIVYLSGRDIPNMARGTLDSLEKMDSSVHTPLISVILNLPMG